MIEIKKGRPPEELLILARQAKEEGLSPEEAYETLRNPLKKQVTEQLAREQGHLCAYCMRRIPDDRPGIPHLSIEHIRARNPQDGRDEAQGLDYANFFAVCSGNRGGDGRGKGRLTCDAHRGNELLTVNPGDLTTLETIAYSESGEISASDPTIHDDLTVKLNLNCISDGSSLPAARKEALDAVQMDLMSGIETAEQFLDACHKRLRIFETETDPKTPYVGIIIWKLKQYIARLR